MSDDLVKRLRSVLGYKDLGICPEAADRIEELEAAALQDLFDLGSDYEIDCATKEEWAQRAFNAEARIKELEATLAELEGQDDGSA